MHVAQDKIRITSLLLVLSCSTLYGLECRGVDACSVVLPPFQKRGALSVPRGIDPPDPGADMCPAGPPKSRNCYNGAKNQRILVKKLCYCSKINSQLKSRNCFYEAKNTQFLLHCSKKQFNAKKVGRTGSHRRPRRRRRSKSFVLL